MLQILDKKVGLYECKRWVRFFLVMILSSFFTFLLSCSSGKPVKSDKVIDPVTLQVKGVNNPEVLNNINAYLEGLPTISKRRVRLYSPEITDKITLAVHSFGYYHPKVSFTYPKRHDTSAVLGIDVDLGKTLFIRYCNIEITGEGAYYESFAQIVRNSGLGPYKLLNHGAYEELKTALRNNAQTLGFFDSHLVSSRILVYQDQNVADISVIFDTGKRYKFGDIRISEESRALLAPAESLIDIQKNGSYSAKKVANISQNLSRTNYYRSVDVQTLVEERKNGEVPVSIEVERKPTHHYRLGVGFSTDESIRGLVGWDMPMVNSMGHAYTSFVRASREKKTAQLIYKIPHKDPNLNYFYIKLAQTRVDWEDTLSDISHASLHYVDNIHGNWKRDYYIAGEYEDYKQASQKGHPTNLMLGLTLLMSSSTGGIDPKMGFSVSFDNRIASSAISDQTFWHSELVFSGVYTFFEDYKFIYKLMQGANIGRDAGDVPPSMRFFAGGDRILRGFGYKSESVRDSQGKLLGSRYITAGTAEFEFPIGISNSRGAVFMDAAVCTNNYVKDHHLLLGPGIGYRFISDYGIFKIDLAYGINSRRDYRKLRLHVAFGLEF